MNLDKEVETVNCSINSDTELTLRFEMNGNSSIITEMPELSLQKKISNLSSRSGSIKNESPSLKKKPIVEPSTFNIKDRLNLFDKKKTEGKITPPPQPVTTFQKSLTLPPSLLQKLSPSNAQNSNTEIAQDNKKDQITTTSSSSLITQNPNESFLGFISNEEYNKLLIKDTKEPIPQRDCFCEGFFLASFPFKGGKVIEKSQEYPSICNHTKCSMLRAMQPEII